MILPGMGARVLGLTGAGGGGAPPVTAKSFVFNGTNEGMSRTLSTTAPNNTTFTYSLWLKIVAYISGNATMFQVLSPDESEFFLWNISVSGDRLENFLDANWGERVSGITDIPVATWEHWVLRLDSTQGADDDRIRMYRNGTLQTDSILSQIGLNDEHRLFEDGWSHDLAAEFDIGFFSNMKLAFIDVLEGVSVDPLSFAFDNAGTWTRKPYVGSRGTYGFSLDGTDGFNDVSGNNQHFSGSNMDASNLDADVPPHVMV